MNFEEGKRFVRELLIAFPAFDDAAKNTPDIGATHRRWIDAWNDLSFVECMDVLDGLVKRGEIGYEDYRAPGPFIRRLVMANRRNTPKSEADIVQESLERRQREKTRRNYKGSPMAAALAHGLKLRDEGASQEVVFAAMDRILAGGKC